MNDTLARGEEETAQGRTEIRSQASRDSSACPSAPRTTLQPTELKGVKCASSVECVGTGSKYLETIVGAEFTIRPGGRLVNPRPRLGLVRLAGWLTCGVNRIELEQITMLIQSDSTRHRMG